jgi:hypothetical protein
VPATPATLPEAVSLAATSPNPAKGRLSYLAVCFVNPGLTGEMRSSRFSLGQTIEHLWGAPKPKGFWVYTCGHTCSWPQKIQVDPVRPTTLG